MSGAGFGGARGAVPAILVHGGAGASPDDAPDELRAGIRSAVEAGWRALVDGRSALDAVEAAIGVLEDHPRFNAGYGSVLTAEGTVEVDAALMAGRELRCGAVAALPGIRHPITAARRVLEDGRHILLAGPGALAFCRACGLPEEPADALVTERQRRRSATGTGTPEAGGTGTVGAVAIDIQGTLAAGTSTGGTAGKLPGRVGDSPLIGCGTYADDTLGAVSCTGDGEAIIRVVLARRALDYLREADDPVYAARVAVELLVDEGHGRGGLILLDWRGRLGWACSTPAMPIGWMARGSSGPSVTL